MLFSARRNIPYPDTARSDRPDVPAHIGNLVTPLELDLIYDQGTDADRLARAHLEGVLFWTTDTHFAWYDDGATWWRIGATLVNGRVAADGTKTAGAATFASSRTSQGVYVVDFTPDLAAIPVVTLTVVNTGGARRLIQLGAVAAETMTVEVIDATGGAQDAAFHFSAQAVL